MKTKRKISPLLRSILEALEIQWSYFDKESLKAHLLKAGGIKRGRDLIPYLVISLKPPPGLNKKVLRVFLSQGILLGKDNIDIFCNNNDLSTMLYPEK